MYTYQAKTGSGFTHKKKAHYVPEIRRHSAPKRNKKEPCGSIATAC